ncbi:MAG: hypothetical protein SOT67_08105 [Bacteroidaceae bacterium]|nr:hypothetical protein [Prevotellaceae bacterium]MDY2850196.1 hypothetical protein [Bacteroidaceae bacterium]
MTPKQSYPLGLPNKEVKTGLYRSTPPHLLATRTARDATIYQNNT